MALITENIQVTIVGQNLKKYRKLGYNCNVGDKLEVPINTLSEKSAYKIKYKCESCNQIFTTKFYLYKKNKLGLCQKCNKKVTGTNLVNDSIINKRFHKLIVLKRTIKKDNIWMYLCQCDCGKYIEVTKQRLKRKTTRSCGCLRSQKSSERLIKHNLKNRGSKHYNWNPNYTEEDRIKNKNLRGRMKYLSKKCFERDNYTCQICNKRGTLNAHHLNSFIKYENERFNLDNLITLCIDCHIDYHKNYKIDNVNKQSFLEYTQNVRQ